MRNPHFENKSLTEFLKAEFKHRKNSKGLIRNVAGFFQLLFFGVFNFYTKKEWNKQYKVIKNSTLRFYPNVECLNISEKLTLATIFKISLSSNRTERFEFNFNKAHLAITANTIFVFPYKEPELNSRSVQYNILEVPFRIIFKQNQEIRKYHSNQNLKFISLENNKENTVLTFKVDELEEESKIIIRHNNISLEHIHPNLNPNINQNV